MAAMWFVTNDQRQATNAWSLSFVVPRPSLVTSSIVAMLLLAGCASRPRPVSVSPRAQVVPPPAPATPPTPATEPPKPAEDLSALIYPHQPGDTWELRMSGEAEAHLVTLAVLPEAAKPSSTPSSLSPAQPGEPATFRLETKRDGVVVARDRYLADAGAVYLTAQGYPGETRVEPPMPILKLPIVAGGAWTWKGAFKAAGGSVPAVATFTVAGPEGVETPAGTFQAYRVEQKLTFRAKTGPLLFTTTQWLAPKVGLVKQTVETPDTRGEAVLVSYRLANATTEPAGPSAPGASPTGGPPVSGGAATSGGLQTGR